MISLSACEKPVLEIDEHALGDISIKVSGSAIAQPYFKEGMLYLHSFEYKDAAEKFRKAQELDPDFAMAYWGEAMTLNHPLWREQEYKEAKEILKKLGENKEEQLSKFKTDFEKDMFRAVSILYGPGNKKDRDENYSKFLKTLVKKYPDNHEVKAFYALSIIGTSKGGRNQALYNQGATIAASIIKENPRHPGALHYLIHGYDDPDNAPKALEAANAYSKIAPDAAHALHMPSHIYVALGMWDEVISSNVASWEASVKRKEKKELSNNALNYHAFKWLMYAHLQKKEFAEAKKLVENMKQYCEEDPTSKALSHLIMMRGAYCVEANDWDQELLSDTLDYTDLPVQLMGAYQFTKSMNAYLMKEDKAIMQSISSLEKYIAENQSKLSLDEPQMCSGSYLRGRPSQLHVDRATVMLMECKALSAKLKGNHEMAIKLIKEASLLEENTSYMYGPPEVIKPSKELLAEWLIEQKDYTQANDLFKEVLKRAPKRRLALEGINQCEKLK